MKKRIAILSEVKNPCITVWQLRPLVHRAALPIFLVVCLVAAAHPAAAAPPPSDPTIHALFLSDIHFDALHDPARARQLNTAPLSQWPAILAEPDSPTQAADYAAIDQVCPIKPLPDTADPLWQSTLDALHAQAPHLSFLTLTGDILGHRFDCRYKQIFPNATHAQFVAFVDKTFRFVIDGLRHALPGVPLYIAMGNNDTACADHELDPVDDQFLAFAAPIVARALHADSATRAAVLRTFPHGYYSAPLPAPMARTRILVIDDIYSMRSYRTCSGQSDPQAQAPELAWLTAQLRDARLHHRKLWIIGHVPPGVNPYSTFNYDPKFCSTGQPAMFLGSDQLSNILAANSDVVALGLFAHSHTDEMRLVRTDTSTSPPGDTSPGVPIKIVPAISPVFAELPSFTLAKIDPRTAVLRDYTVVMASNSTGIRTTWSPSYTYSQAYNQPDFSALSLDRLIADFRADPAASTPASQSYIREYRHAFFDDKSVPIQPHWPAFVCTMDRFSPATFTACACPAGTP